MFTYLASHVSICYIHIYFPYLKEGLQGEMVSGPPELKNAYSKSYVKKTHIHQNEVIYCQL
jgi:hypothetical protein